MGHWYYIPFPRFRDTVEEWGGRSLRARDQEGLEGNCFLDMTPWYSWLMKSLQLWLPAHDLHKTKPVSTQQHRRERDPWATTPSEPLPNWWDRKRLFSLRVWPLVRQSYSSPEVYGQHKRYLVGYLKKRRGTWAWVEMRDGTGFRRSVWERMGGGECDQHTFYPCMKISKWIHIYLYLYVKF